MLTAYGVYTDRDLWTSWTEDCTILVPRFVENGCASLAVCWPRWLHRRTSVGSRLDSKPRKLPVPNARRGRAGRAGGEPPRRDPLIKHDFRCRASMTAGDCDALIRRNEYWWCIHGLHVPQTNLMSPCCIVQGSKLSYMYQTSLIPAPKHSNRPCILLPEKENIRLGTTLPSWVSLTLVMGRFLMG